MGMQKGAHNGREHARGMPDVGESGATPTKNGDCTRAAHSKRGRAARAGVKTRPRSMKEVGKFADKPGSVEHRRQAGDIGQSFLWATRYREALAAYPGATRATPMLPYLALPRMGFTVPVLSPVLR